VLRVATDPGKAHPIVLRRRHRPAQYDALAQTGPLDSQSAVAHRSGRSAASRVRPLLLFRTAITASSMSPRDRVLSPPVVCSERLDRSTNLMCGLGCPLPGKERSRRDAPGCARPYILPHPAAVRSALGSCRGRVHQTDNDIAVL
jgi:hypothetical protein